MSGVVAAAAADSFPANYGRPTRTVQQLARQEPPGPGSRPGAAPAHDTNGSVGAIEMAADVAGGHGLNDQMADRLDSARATRAQLRRAMRRVTGQATRHDLPGRRDPTDHPDTRTSYHRPLHIAGIGAL